MVKFFKHSTGTADSAQKYLTKDEGRTNSPPEIIEGDIEQTVAVINSTDRKHTHTSGVISFSPDDEPTREELLEVIKDFKDHFFAGLEPDQYSVVFIRHSHLDREEIHFLAARTELTTGKALNIAPPTETHAFKERWVQAWNYTKDWADPGDPDRAREISHPPAEAGHGYKLLPTKIEITEFLKDQIALSVVQDRKTMVQALEDVGLTVTRQGRDYISVKTEEGTPVRLKGRIYAKDWTYDTELDRATAGEDGKRPFRNPEDDARRAEEAWADVAIFRAKRAEYNRKRYPRSSQLFEAARTVDPDYLSGLPGDLDRLFDLSIQPELVPRPADNRKAKRAEQPELTSEPDRSDRRLLDTTDRNRDVSSVAGTDDTHVQKQPTLHTDHEVTSDVRLNSTRERALEHARATAKDLDQISARAEVSTRAADDTAERNRQAVAPGGILDQIFELAHRLVSKVTGFFQQTPRQDRDTETSFDLG